MKLVVTGIQSYRSTDNMALLQRIGIHSMSHCLRDNEWLPLFCIYLSLTIHSSCWLFEFMWNVQTSNFVCEQYALEASKGLLDCVGNIRLANRPIGRPPFCNRVYRLLAKSRLIYNIVLRVKWLRSHWARGNFPAIVVVWFKAVQKVFPAQIVKLSHRRE